jgi:hypothetical protein
MSDMAVRKRGHEFSLSADTKHPKKKKSSEKKKKGAKDPTQSTQQTQFDTHDATK